MTGPMEIRKNLEKARGIAVGLQRNNRSAPEAETAHGAAIMIHDATEALLCCGVDRKKMPWFLSLTEPARA